MDVEDEILEELEENEREIALRDCIIEEKEKTIEENVKIIGEKEKTIEEKEKELNEKEQKLINSAKKMKNYGVPIDEIIFETGLSKERIEIL
jgi:DNA repair ATPase RecN